MLIYSKLNTKMKSCDYLFYPIREKTNKQTNNFKLTTPNIAIIKYLNEANPNKSLKVNRIKIGASTNF